jgi:DNA-binding response OmpR family regulator
MPASRATSMTPHCRVLVVEDEQTIAANLVEYLEAHGHAVDLAHDGPAAIARVKSATYDVIVLDLGLPRLDGLQVLQQLRRTLGVATPVLVLTARDALSSKLDTFASGADDYLLKPFALAEVQTRILALHRRASGAVVTDVLRAGDLLLDRRTLEVRIGDRPVHVMPRGLRILELLMRDPGRVVARTDLEAALWPDDAPESDALRSQIHLLRRALVQAGFEGLETVHGIGYRLRCEPHTAG